MCGIISYFSNNFTYRRDYHNAIKQLISVDSLRGYNSTGLLTEEDDKPSVFKKAVAGYDFVQLTTAQGLISNYNNYRYLVAHNRAATQGSVVSANAHPFQHKDITGVHNGTIRNHKSLSNGSFDVDSEYIFHALSYKDTKDVIPKINGAFNLIWHDERDDSMHMVRNEDRPYVFAVVERKPSYTIFGASEEGMLEWILARNNIKIIDYIIPEPYEEYIFKLSKLSKPNIIKHEEYVAPSYSSNNNYNNYNNNNYNTANSYRSRVENKIEFYVNQFERTGSSANNYGTFTGYSLDGDPVEVFNCTVDELDFETWYEGDTVSYSSYGSDTIIRTSIKKSILEDDDDKFEYECIHCKEKHTYEDTVFLDHSPICIECCTQFNLSDDEIELDRRKPWL